MYSFILSFLQSSPPLWSNSKCNPSSHSPQTALFRTLILTTSQPKFAQNSQEQALSMVIKGIAESD